MANASRNRGGKARRKLLAASVDYSEGDVVISYELWLEVRATQKGGADAPLVVARDSEGNQEGVGAAQAIAEIAADTAAQLSFSTFGLAGAIEAEAADLLPVPGTVVEPNDTEV